MYPYWLFTEEAREKNVNSIKAGYASGKRKAYFKDKKRPDISKRMKDLYREVKLIPINMIGEVNPAWKGDNASYSAIHHWLAFHKKKIGICKNCNKKPKTRTEYANLSGEYKRDVNDYAELCVSCHRLFDYGKLKLNFVYG